MRAWLVALITILALHIAPQTTQARSDVTHKLVAGVAPLQRRLLQADSSNSAAPGINSSSSVDSNATSNSSSSGVTPAAPTKKRCRPSLIDVARTIPELRQSVQLAMAGFNMFSVDGGKPFTVLVPTNAAIQSLAAEVADTGDQINLEDGFYSIILYHQIPQGAYDTNELLQLGYEGLQTSLGRAFASRDDRYSVSFDGSTRPVVATGGWPANNARLVGQFEACNGWLHMVDGVLRPTQSLSDLPRLVDDIPDFQNGSFWSLLDGSLLSTAAPAPASEGDGSGSDGVGDVSPSPSPSDTLGMPPHSNGSDIAVSSGDGTLPPNSSAAPASSNSSGGGGGGENVLVIAASVAGGAVALCAAVVAVVLLRKRAAHRRRRLGRVEVLACDEDDGERSPTAKRSASLRPLQLRVDA